MIINLKHLGELKIQDIFGTLMVFFSFIPWVHFGLNNRDSQFWPALFASLFILFSPHVNFKREYLLIALIPFSAFIVWLNYSTQVLDFIAIRAMASYFTFSLCLAGFLIYFYNYEFPWKLLIFINFLYLFIACIQIFYPDLTSSFVQVRGLGQAGRGVTSLTPEPTYFGIFLYLISFIFLAKSNFKPSSNLSILLLLNFLSIIFLSRSSTVVVFLIISIIFFSLTRFNYKKIFIFIICFFIILNIGLILLEDSRIFFLGSQFYELGLLNLIYLDESINDRVANVIYPIHGLYENNFLPGGFHSFKSMHAELNDYYSGFFYYGRGSTSIMSFVGVFFYELGFIGIIILGFIFFKIQDGTYSRFMDTLLLFIILNSSVPPSFPLVPFIIAIYLSKLNMSSNSLSRKV
jgi:hypothetical protein